MATADFAITDGRIEDAAAIARLSGELGYASDADLTARMLGQMNASPNYRVMVARSADALLGWVAVEHRLSLESGDSAELTGLVVTAAARQRGVGRALVAAAEAWARGRGFSVLRVRSSISRAESHPFYAALGFQRSKTQHVYAKPLALPAGGTDTA